MPTEAPLREKEATAMSIEPLSAIETDTAEAEYIPPSGTSTSPQGDGRKTPSCSALLSRGMSRQESSSCVKICRSYIG